MQKITFNNKNNLFFQRLKEKVDLYFKTNNTVATGNTKLYVKSIFQVCSAIGLYISLVFLHPDPFLAVILCALLGSNLAFIGFNIMHEGGHQSFSKIKWINQLSAYSLNVLGGSALFWKTKHNINHHTYTNIEGMDDDINVQPYMRIHATQRRYWIHRFQHIYWFLLYGITYLSWIFIDDFVKYFSGKIVSNSDHQKWTFKEHLIFWCTKLGYISLYIGLPVYFAGFINTLIGFGIMTFVCGLTIAVVFQMAHVVENTAFPKPDKENNKINKEWAIHQIETTANFGTGNKTLSWFLGGLNFQVEHHLFPRISHVHYPAINKLVKETCKEFNVSYLEFSSLGTAFWSHLKHIRKMGIAG
ncbi:MAG: acyl-CoA desaturase [Chitinophagaceae bacterium]|nr:acyl-CoA desaturase [Chitinophagaceae bacterium]